MRLITLLLLLLTCFGTAWAQGENNNWAFGFLQGLTFASGAPVYMGTNMRNTTMGVSPNGPTSCSTVSDAQGQLLFYTDGKSIWDGQHQLMTNACSTCDGAIAQLNGGIDGHNVLIVKRPTSASLYYVFTADSRQNPYNAGLSYTEVDMSLRGGKGGVTAVRNLRLPTPTLTSVVLDEIAGMQHTNRRDVWVVVHGLGNDSFYSFLVTATGVNPTPVTSSSGTLGAGRCRIKFAPDGRQLVRTGYFGPVQLFNFDGATGSISNAQVLDANAGNYPNYDLEFSADATKLYHMQMSSPISSGSMPQGNYLYQYDLKAGSTAAIANSKLLIYKSLLTDPNYTPVADMEIGPDGRIYGVLGGSLSTIDRPNRRGSDINFRPLGLPRPTVNGISGIDTWGLQNTVRLQPPSLDYMAETACAGSTVSFAPYEIPTGTGPLTWTFYDPLTGTADSVPGPSATRAYPMAGTYRIKLSTTLRGQYYSAYRNLIISPLPDVALPDTVWLCTGPTVLSLPTQPAGTTIRWSDKSTQNTLAINGPGKYWVEARNYQGCTRADTTLAIACLVPNVITPNLDKANETFRLVGLQASDWSMAIYNRWGRLVYQQDRYDNRWNASNQSAGVYYYLLRNRHSGQQLKGYVEVVR